LRPAQALNIKTYSCFRKVLPWAMPGIPVINLYFNSPVVAREDVGSGVGESEGLREV
jgi:hypothetical protein